MGYGSPSFATMLHDMPFVRKLSLLFFAVVIAGCSTTETLRVPVPVSTSSKYAAVVVDGNSGRVLYASAADEPRFPASLTKMMTLYILFEALESGRVSMSTPIPVSASAASRPPSKIGLKPGESIDVDTAIRALATKSANDVACAIGEYFAGSEAAFADVMTAKARQLGMKSTVFRNASGLPDAAQRTTARDMAKLSLALRSRFPQYFPYFSAQSFTYRGKVIRGHNDLLGKVAGVNGIKTGYTRASGYNIATSVDKGERRLVLVVMGEETAKARNDHVEALIARFM
jgi:D-alanyl-D-alanine carboxypeptidase